jgi:hypothetical protein
MRPQRRRCRVAWIAIFAMLWHAVMPLAHAAGMSQGLLSSICSVAETRQERIGLPAGKQEAPASDLLKQCPLCAAGAHFAVVDEPAASFFADDRLAHVLATIAPLASARLVAWLHFSPRAPPQSLIDLS